MRMKFSYDSIRLAKTQMVEISRKITCKQLLIKHATWLKQLTNNQLINTRFKLIRVKA